MVINYTLGCLYQCHYADEAVINVLEIIMKVKANAFVIHGNHVMDLL